MGVNEKKIQELKDAIRTKRKEIRRLESDVKELEKQEKMSSEEWSKITSDKPISEWPPLPDDIEFIYYAKSEIIVVNANKFAKAFAHWMRK